MKVIELTRGKVAIVDDEDFEQLAQYRWYCSARNYAVRGVPGTAGRKKIYMHTVICPSPGVTDHKNGDTLDNRRCNLRPASDEQNHHNRRNSRNNTSGFKGVYKAPDGFVARIMAYGNRKYLGTYTTPQEAHAAYCAAATELHGEFARFN